MKHLCKYALSAAIAVWMGCSEPESTKRKLVLKTTALTVEVGDTSAVVKASKSDVDARGKQTQIDDYPYFMLVSGDTSVAGIAERKRVVGRKPGTAHITARDENSSLVSENHLTVTVQ